MKPSTIIGILLIALGILGLTYKGITYTSREKVIDVGPIVATADTKKTIPISPLIGVVAIVSGTILLLARGRRI